MRWALISVSDKTGLADFATSLVELGFGILSTGGTAQFLRDAGLTVTDVSTLTGFPEVMDGRVKTLHPLIHGGLLARRDNTAHTQVMAEHHMPNIELLVVNLYPFVETVAKNADEETCIENIDIGGPAMLRSAAKNHQHVAVITESADYDIVLQELTTQGQVSLLTKRRLAAKVFITTAAYDAAIADYLSMGREDFFGAYAVGGRLKQVLRYGENPHQKGALYISNPQATGVGSAQQLQGKELSYNNIADADAAFNAVCDFNPNIPACVIVKHANPCGVALGKTPLQAWKHALRCDTVSAFGGIAAFNTEVDAATADALTELFLEVVVAPSFSLEAQAILATKKNVRVLSTGKRPTYQATWQVRSVVGGFLVQNRDMVHVEAEDLRIVTKRQPTPQELQDMVFAFRVAKHVHSNAIVLAANNTTIGIGAGQMSRLDSAVTAARKAQIVFDNLEDVEKTTLLQHGLVVASDAFFPFADGLEAAASAGVTAVIQPGGSMRDQEVIDAADARGLAMAFTGIRHFLH